MSTNCKVTKIISLIMLVLGVITVGSGCLLLYAVSSLPADSALIGDMLLYSQVLAGLIALTGVVCFIAGIMGARGANHPAKLGGFIVLASIMAVVNAFEVAMAITVGSSVWQNLLYAVLCFAGAYFASRAKKEATRL